MYASSSDSFSEGVDGMGDGDFRRLEDLDGLLLGLRDPDFFRVGVVGNLPGWSREPARRDGRRGVASKSSSRCDD
jgi:hypothetical protein